METAAPSRRACEIGAVERHGADAGQHDLRFHEGREVDVEREGGERRHVAFVDAAVGDDFEIGLAGEGLHRRAEAAGGGVAGQVDGDDYRDAEGHGEDGERGAQQVAAQRAQDEGAQELHGGGRLRRSMP